MPLEIRELHIKVNVNQPQQASQGDTSETGDDAEKKDALINQCIEEVMNILKNKNER